MCTNLMKKINKSITLFLFFENIISFGHVKNVQNLDWKNLAFDQKKGSLRLLLLSKVNTEY